MPRAIPAFRPPRLREAPTEAEQARPNAHQRGYCDEAWRRLRREVLLRDDYQCTLCKRIVDGHRQAHVDHIIPRRDGGSDTLGNLRTLCHSCHSSRTASESWGKRLSSSRREIEGS